MSASRGCIAIVDDDPGMRRALERLLRVARFDTHAFGSAEEFLGSAAPEHYACLVLDIKLPGISGLELYCRLRENNVRLQTIFITAQEMNWKCEKAGNRVSHEICLYKPFPAAALLDALESALGRVSLDGHKEILQ